MGCEYQFSVCQHVIECDVAMYCARWDVAVQIITTNMRCEYLLSVCQHVSGCSAALYGAEWSVKF